MVTVGLIGGVLLLIVSLRARRSMLEGSDEEWRRQWQALAPERRKAIRRSLRRGEAMHDANDAELALRAVAQTEHVRRSMRPITIVAVPMLSIWLVAGVLADQLILVVGTALALALGVVLAPVSWFQTKRLRQSAEATRRLTENPRAGARP